MNRRSFSSSIFVIGAFVCFLISAVTSAYFGRYWFMLSQVGFAVAMCLILTGAEDKSGAVWPILFWGALVVGVLAVLAGSLV